jgi:hypothetical protein
MTTPKYSQSLKSSGSTVLSVGAPISSISALPSLKKEWDELYCSSSLNSIFLSYEFVYLWYSCFAGPDDVRVYPIYEGNKLIAFLPLVLLKARPLRVLSSLVNNHCFHAGPLVRKGYEQSYERCIIDYLPLRKNEWDVLIYHSGYSFQTHQYFKNISQTPLHLQERILPTYTILLPDSYDSYINNALSSKLRNNIKKWTQRLSMLPSYKFSHYRGDAAISSWPTFLAIEDSGWKGQGGSSIKKLSLDYQSYYDGLLHILAKHDQLHMYFLEIDGRAVAGTFGYEDMEILHYAKTGYIEDNHSSVSPSNLVLMYVVKDTINSLPDVKRINQFPWDYGYKHRFINESSFLHEFTLYNRTISGNAAYFLLQTKENIKQVQGMAPAINLARKIINKLNP